MEHYLFADSKNRDVALYPHGNTYVLHMTKPLRNVTRVDLVSAKVPNSMYNLNNGSNCFSINSEKFSLYPGFYTAYGLAETMSYVTGLLVEYQPDEGKFIISSKTSFTIDVSNPELRIMTGITHANSYTTTGTVYENKYPGDEIVKSDTLIDLSTNEFIFLDIDELRTQKVLDSKKLVGESYDGATIATSFGMIPLDVASAQIKTFKETTDYKLSISFEHPIPRLTRLNVKWLDKNGRVLTFNGFDNNAFVLRFHCNESAPPEPEKESDFEILSRKLERAIQDAIPPPKPEKKRPVWIYISVIAVLLLIIFKLSRTSSK